MRFDNDEDGADGDGGGGGGGDKRKIQQATTHFSGLAERSSKSRKPIIMHSW